MPPAFAARYESYIAPARKRAELWRLLLGLCIAALIYAAWASTLVVGYWWLTSPDISTDWMRAIPDAQTPAHTYVLLATFIGMGLGPILVVRYLHKRRAATLFGRAARVLRDFCLSAGLVGAVYAVSLGLWFARFDGVVQLDLSLWLILLPLSLLAVLIQTGAEELVFRGYLQQQLAARFASPLIWLLLPSLAFGLAHYDPATSAGNLWFVVAATTLFGLAAADLTAQSGSLGAAWGFHFANNVAALLVVAVKGTIPGLALYTTPYGAADPMLGGLIVADMLALAVAWLLVRRVVRR